MTPFNINGASIYFADIIFFLLLYGGIRERHRWKKSMPAIECAITKELFLFLIYTIILAFYSLYIEVPFTTVVRFCINIAHYALYFFFPYILYNNKRLNTFYGFIALFLFVAYIICLSQNIIGWQPSSVEDPESMSYVEKVGWFFRAWNPVAKWLIVATCYSLSWIMFQNKSVKSVGLFCSLLIFAALTFTRNVYLSLIFSFLLLFLLQRMLLKKKNRIKTFVVTLLLLYVTVTAILQLFPFVIERFSLGISDFQEGTACG